MSGVSDKVRFYMEQAVPQLQEFEQKKIFSKAEIKTLVKKRSDFEHKVLARGALPEDFVRYVAWEISLEKLRAKRVKRLHVTGSQAHTGQGRIQQILDRATRRHPGDLRLWFYYLSYARSTKSTKKFKVILTSAIRLHPTKPELWLYAAKYCLEEESDVNSARSYMQRGTRFCNKTPQLWIEYAKLEMIFLQKISMRRRILGLETPGQGYTHMDEGEMNKEDDGFAAGDDDVDFADATLPNDKVTTLRPSMIDGVAVDTQAVQDPMATPALNGAIPIVIFDDSRKQPFYCVAAAKQFFDMFAAFSNVHCQAKVVNHVVNSMMEQYKREPAALSCYIRQPIVGVDVQSDKFASVLATVLERVNTSIQETKDRKALAEQVRTWAAPILALQDLDSGVQTFLAIMLNKISS